MDCVALAAQLRPHTPVRMFVDNDRSAADSTVGRPHWRAMLDALRFGDFDRVRAPYADEAPVGSLTAAVAPELVVGITPARIVAKVNVAD